MAYLNDVATLLNGKLHGADTEFTSFSTDTRQLKPGELFIALTGERFNGHDFLQTALQKQAAGAIVSEKINLPMPTIQVPDTLLALGKLAAHHRTRFELPIIALTGSCGKTTTKTMIASILSQMGETLSPEKSFNNEVGVPLTLLQLNTDHRYAVIEMGANHPGEIAYLSQLTKQTVAMITNVAPAHLEGFGSIEGVAKAKSEIYQALSDEGVAIANADDQFFNFWQPLICNKKTITFGIRNNADVMAKNIVLDDKGRASFMAIYKGHTISIKLPLLGAHNVANALAAIAASHVVGASPDAIKTGLEKVVPVAKRMVTYKGIAGALIIDDTYNANPLSVSAALNMLAKSKGRKIFVFGDMGELGHQEEQLHAEIGQQARDLGIDKLYACGKLSHLTVAAFGNKGSHFKDQASLIEALKPELSPDVIVLIKGSRSSRMETVVEAITQEN